jgi:N-acetylglucosamine transport system substrate-binding protein
MRFSGTKYAVAGMSTAVALILAACAAPDNTTATTSPAAPATTSDTAAAPGTTSAPAATDTTAAADDNPFGLKPGSAIDAVVFDGGYKTDYVDFACGVLTKKFPDVKCTVTATSQISQEMQPRFVGGNPPDLLDNQGAQSIPISSIIDQLSKLDDLWNATNYDGTKISDAVYASVRNTGTINGNFIEVPYVMTLWAFYYSKSLFDANGWQPPRTWDEAMQLCTEAKAKNLYLFTWGKEAASYWKTLALDSAFKQGGYKVVEDIANLKPGAWSSDTMKTVLTKFKALIDAGCFIPGGSGTQFTQAQAQWSNDQKALLYYTGSWIENEMKGATADNFQMTASPAIVVDESTAKLPFEAVEAGADEKFVVPAQGANVAGGMELLRAMLSKEAASNFAKTRLAPTIVKDTVPADGFGSTALASANKMLSDAGSNTFAWAFSGYDQYYAFNTDELVIWNAFLDGAKSGAQLISEEEAWAATVAADASVTKVTYDFSH